MCARVRVSVRVRGVCVCARVRACARACVCVRVCVDMDAHLIEDFERYRLRQLPQFDEALGVQLGALHEAGAKEPL